MCQELKIWGAGIPAGGLSVKTAENPPEPGQSPSPLGITLYS